MILWSLDWVVGDLKGTISPGILVEMAEMAQDRSRLIYSISFYVGEDVIAK